MSPTKSTRPSQASTSAKISVRAKPEFRYRLALSHSSDNPNYIRLQEMANNVLIATNGRMAIEVHGCGVLGNDDSALAMVRDGELEMFLGGNVFGPLVPVSEMPGLPFLFADADKAFAALDGALGDYIRGEIWAKGLYAFRRGFDNGFHQLTTYTKPIRVVDDLVGMTFRTPPHPIKIDFFETLGAKAIKFPLSELYEVLRNRVVDGQTDPAGMILSMKLYEVQTFLSLTSHWCSSFTLVSNAAAWKALPDNFRTIIDKYAEQAALAQRRDLANREASALDALRAKGMMITKTDTDSFKKRLRDYYARWRKTYGNTAWISLEAHVGELR